MTAAHVAATPSAAILIPKHLISNFDMIPSVIEGLQTGQSTLTKTPI
jgi:hypothetical protein